MQICRNSVGTLLVLITTINLSACNSEQSPLLEERIRPVRTAVAVQAPEDIKRRFAGSSQAASTSNISFRVSGIISEFPAQVGIPLKKGDLIARLDSNDYQTKLEQEKAALGRVVINAENSKSRFNRIEKLFAKHIISEMDFETAKAEYQAGEAEVQQAQRSVELSRDQLAYTKLKAPADGCAVTEATATENENVTAGEAIAIISCGSIMEVVGVIPESVVNRVSIGQQVEVLFNAIEGENFKAEVTEMGVSSSANGVYLVTARVNKRDSRLRPGMAVELVLARQFEVSDNQVWVPMVAVGEEDKQRFVMVYQPVDELMGTVKRVNVETGRYALGSLEIIKGLQKNQIVITAGLSQIQNGLTVKLLKQDL